MISTHAYDMKSSPPMGALWGPFLPDQQIFENHPFMDEN
jgi:hypothetical protein